MQKSTMQFQIPVQDRSYWEIIVNPPLTARETWIKGMFPKVNNFNELQILVESGIIGNGNTAGFSVPITNALEVLAPFHERALIKNLNNGLVSPESKALVDSTVLIEPESLGLQSGRGFEHHVKRMRALSTTAEFPKDLNNSFIRQTTDPRKQKAPELDRDKYNKAWERFFSSDRERVKLTESILTFSKRAGSTIPINISVPIHPEHPSSLDMAGQLARETLSVAESLQVRKIATIAMSNPALRRRKIVKGVVNDVMSEGKFGNPEFVYFEIEDCDVNGDTEIFRNMKYLVNEMFLPLKEKNIGVIVPGCHMALGVALSACGVLATSTHIGGKLGFRQGYSGGGGRVGRGPDIDELDWTSADAIDDHIDEHGSYPQYTPTGLQFKQKISQMKRNDWNITRKKLGAECVDELNRLLTSGAHEGVLLEGVAKRLWQSKYSNLCKLLPNYNELSERFNE